MTPNEYQQLALRTMADQGVIDARRKAMQVWVTQLENGVRGLTDEAGELNSALKKFIEYGGELDRVNVLEECGDVLWRVSQILDGVGFTVEQAMEGNIRKLEKRYPEKYSDVQALGRDLAAERAAVSTGMDKPAEVPVDDGTVLTTGRIVVVGGLTTLDPPELGQRFLDVKQFDGTYPIEGERTVRGKSEHTH